MTTTLRYRRQFKRFSDASKDNEAKNKVTFALTYSPESNEYWIKTNYIRSDRKNIFNHKKTDHTFEMGAGRRIGNWFPYFDLSDVAVKSDSSTRQLRTRIGIKYYY